MTDHRCIVRVRSASKGRLDVALVDVETRIIFDGNWEEQTLTREEYVKRYKEADAR